jgi:hypothetical protein
MGKHELIKEIDGVLFPFLPQGESVSVDGMSYQVRSCTIVVEGRWVIAHVRVR